MRLAAWAWLVLFVGLAAVIASPNPPDQIGIAILSFALFVVLMGADAIRYENPYRRR